METPKSPRTKIINIFVVKDSEQDDVIYGLGDDSLIYTWSAHKRDWVLFG